MQKGNNKTNTASVMPAEWEKQHGILLSFPLKAGTWPGVRESMERSYAQFVAAVSRHEKAYINCIVSEQARVGELFAGANADMEQITFLANETNDAWIRDYGPIFLKNRSTGEREIVHFKYNAWGGKFPPWDLDAAIPEKIAARFRVHCHCADLVCEGGALEVNGQGTLLTTHSVVCNANRNPNRTQSEVESILCESLGVNCVIMLENGMLGDDTDGHVDTLTRFFNANSVLTMTAPVGHPNHAALERNFRLLQEAVNADGERLNVVPLPSPEPICPQGWREEILPASYSNFLIVNGAVLVPVYGQKTTDDQACRTVAEAFPKREIVPINCRDIVLEGGALHCLSQQIPE